MNIVGKNVERLDARAKATGSAKFTVDLREVGMLTVKFLRSPYSFAEIIAVDTSEAEKMPGVYGFVSQLDLVGRTTHHDILDDRIRFFGEAVVGVAAETEEQALEALDKVEVTYRVLPGVLDFEESTKEDAPRVWPGGNVATWRGPAPVENGGSLYWEKGNAVEAIEKADHKVSITVKTHTQFHGALEPHACTASWDPGMQVLKMNISSQGVFGNQEDIASSLHLNFDQVQVNAGFVGGGFGSKAHCTCKEYVMSAILAQRTLRPVRFEPDRSEECITAVRHSATFSYELAANNDGIVQGIQMKALRVGGAHTSLQMNFLLGSTEYVAPTYLRCDNVAYEGWSVYTNMPLCAAYRGFGYFEGGIGFAEAIDMLAEEIGMDPVEFLLKNVPVKGDPVSTDQGPLTTAGIRETVQACADAIGWKEKYHEPKANRLPDGRYHGIGLCHAMGRATLPNFVTSGNAIVQVKQDGSARVFAGISDIGQGQATAIKQIAAEAIGLPFEAVSVTWGDTVAPHTGDQVASSTTMMTGNAVKLAGDDARKQIIEVAARLLKEPAENLKVENGIVSSTADPEKVIPVAGVIKSPGVKVINGRGNWSITDTVASPRSLVVTACEVAVDTETGKVELLNMVQGTDCGRAICKTRVEGQLDGVLSGGVGYVLTEDCAIDYGDNGRVLNLNLYDYKMPTALDCVDILQPGIIMEFPDEVGPFGARGMGEATLSASAPAIMNAVYNAIGVRFESTPLTCDKVLKAIKAQGSREPVNTVESIN